MRGYDALVHEAVHADIAGWGFGWLDGRATEERPPWGFAGLLAHRLARMGSALDLDTGGGEVVGEAETRPSTSSPLATPSGRPGGRSPGCCGPVASTSPSTSDRPRCSS